MHSLLAFGERFRSERALDDLLVRAPVEEVEENDAGEDRGKRNTGFRSANRIEFLRIRFTQCAPACQDAIPVTHRRKAEENDEETTDQQPDAIERIGNGDRFQPSEERVDRTDQTPTLAAIRMSVL